MKHISINAKFINTNRSAAYIISIWELIMLAYFFFISNARNFLLIRGFMINYVMFETV